MVSPAQLELSELVSAYPMLEYTSATPAHPSLPQVVQFPGNMMPSLRSHIASTNEFFVGWVIVVTPVIAFILSSARLWNRVYCRSQRSVFREEHEELIALLRERIDRWHERANSWEERARHWEERARRWKAYSKRWKERARQAEDYAESLCDGTITASSSSLSFIGAIGNPVEVSFSSAEQSPLLGSEEKSDGVPVSPTTSVHSPDMTQLENVVPIPLSPIPEIESDVQQDDRTSEDLSSESENVDVGSDETCPCAVFLDHVDLSVQTRADDLSSEDPVAVPAPRERSMDMTTDASQESISASLEVTLAEQASVDIHKDKDISSEVPESPASQDLSTESTNPFATPSTSMDSVPSAVLESIASTELQISDQIDVRTKNYIRCYSSF